MVLGGLLLAWAAIAAGSSDPSRPELNLFRLINQLPDAAGAPLVGVMQLGALVAVPVIAAVCVLTGRARLARLVLLGGAGAWAAAKLLDALVAQRPPDERVSGVVLHGAVTPGLSFPSTHVAVAAAMATVASPYVSRSARRTAWLLVTVVAVARVYVGAHFPADVIGGLALGLVVGSVVHLLVGAPRGAPDPAALLQRLREMGTDVVSVDATRPKGSAFRVLTAEGKVRHVRVVDRDAGDADWLYRLWRYVAFRDALNSDEVRDPAHTVDHEALMLLRARRDGIPAPDECWTHRIADGEHVLVRDWVDGSDLDALDLRADPSPLGHAWRLLDELHVAGIALGAPRLSSFVQTGTAVVPIDFSDAHALADEAAMRHDVAELLASSATAVGSDAAARCAYDVIGGPPLADALPVLQPLALSPRTRDDIRKAEGSIDELRASVARVAGVDADRTERPVWVVGRNLAPLILGAVALVVLLGQIGNLNVALDAARHAEPTWLVLAVVCACSGYLMAAVSMMGAAPEPLALGRTTVVQFAAAFTNRIAPAGIGAMATNIRYLERNGIRRARAATTVGVNAAAGGIVHVLLLVTVVPLAGLRTNVPLPATPDFSDYWPVVAVILVVLSGAGFWYWRHGLSTVADRIKPHARDIRRVLAEPRRSALLFGGSLGVTAAQSFVFVASLAAVGVHRPVLTLVAIFLAGSALAAAAPTPGGLGALEAALVAGLAQIGVPTASAVAAVLISRIIGYWLPILPGWFAFHVSTRNGTL